MVDCLAARLGDGERARHVPGDRLAGVDVDGRPEDRDAGLGRDPHLVERPEPGETHAVVFELAVHAEHELAGHADLDAEVGVLRADALDRLERGQEVGVARRPGGVEVDEVDAGLDHLVGHEDDVVGGQLDGLLLRRPRLGDLAEREQLRPVGHGTVGLRVQPQVGHRAVAAAAPSSGTAPAA